MVSPDQSTTDKRNDRPPMVCREWNQTGHILLPPSASSGAVHRKNACNRAIDSTANRLSYPYRKERITNFPAGRCESRNAAGSGAGIMLRDLTAGTQVYLVTGYTDLRRSIDGLAEIVQGQLHLDPFSKALFLFCGRRRDRIKGLLWEGDGFLLLYKRLDNGNFQWPRNETEARLLTPQQTRWLLEGLMIYTISFLFCCSIS